MAGIKANQVGSLARKNPLSRVKVKSPPQRPAGSTAAPSKRLVKRRKATNKAPDGYYANPRERGESFFAVKVNAGNDRNGNSRRGWFVFQVLGGVDPRPVGFVAEDGMGQSALRQAYGDVPSVGEFDIAAAQFNAARKQGGEWIIGAQAKSRAMY